LRPILMNVRRLAGREIQMGFGERFVAYWAYRPLLHGRVKNADTLKTSSRSARTLCRWLNASGDPLVSSYPEREVFHSNGGSSEFATSLRYARACSDVLSLPSSISPTSSEGAIQL